MEHNDISVGLDIGTTKIVAMIGRRNEYGKIELLGTGKAKSLGVHRGVVNNITQTIQSIQDMSTQLVGASFSLYGIPFAIGVNNGLVWKNPLRIYYDNSSIKLGMHTSNSYADGNTGGVNSISLGHDAIAEGDYSSALGTGVKAYSNFHI